MSRLITFIKTKLVPPNLGDEDKNQAAFYLQVIVFISLCSVVAMGVSYALAERWAYALWMLLAVCCYGIILESIRRKHLSAAINLFLFFALFFLTIGILSVGGIHAIGSLLYPIILIYASLLLGRKTFTIYGILSIASVGLIILAENRKITPVYIPDPPDLPLFIAYSLIILSTAFTVRFVTENLQDNLHRKRQSEALYRSLVEVLPMSVCTKDLQGRFTFVNQNYCKEFKLSPADILGKNDFDMHPPDMAVKFQQDDRMVLAGGQAVEMVEEHEPLGGKRIMVQVFKTPVYDAQGQPSGVQIVFWDISERIRAEEEIRHLNESLEQRVAERTMQLEAANRELESLSYTIGHDLRSPIRAIVAYSHILLNELSGRLEAAQESKLRQVNQVSLQMGSMVDEFLSFLRLGNSALQKGPVQMTSLVERVVAGLQKILDGREVEFIINPMPTCVADVYLLEEVYNRLISNAIKFTLPRASARIEIGSLEQPGETCYFVQDNGVGFDMRYAAKLFGIFQRLHRQDEFEGLGIGLATVQRIITRHGGRIWAESEPDKGTTFYFTFTKNTHSPTPAVHTPAVGAGLAQAEQAGVGRVTQES
jgi:PAS domain S-box-containing protein